ncbi:gamma-glutamyltransferase family protein [Nocardia sp. NPDC051832]|uniref:gamma-glutamyltransferase family protein n=1 Tax=Nocardia sp. NPDC051832 TaxID=3155673 RepID=UPI00341FE7D0
MRRLRPLWNSAAATLLALGVLTGCTAAAEDSAPPCPRAAIGTTSPAAPGSTDATISSLATNPEIASGYRSGLTAVRTGRYAVSTANPLATAAACRVLRDGGTAADALVVAQTVLGLVEPQGSGLGGGAFVLYYDAERAAIDAYDGREVAPLAATENYLRWISPEQQVEPKPTVRASGRSIGVPGVVRMLELAHREHGRQPWRDLLAPAADLADAGFAISPRLAEQISASAADLARDAAARAYFLDAEAKPKTAGTVLTNPAYSKTLHALAAEGAKAFYTGAIAQDIVDATASTAGDRTPGVMTLADLSSYEPKKRTALCIAYRMHDICGMPGPSSGGSTVAATLGVLRSFDLYTLRPEHVERDGGRPHPQAAHLIAEAERLAYADRDKYLADPDFVALPGNSPQTLLGDDYLRSRAALIDPRRSMGVAHPGVFAPIALGSGPQPPEHGTSHISVVDSYGNAAAMTTSIESAFGATPMVGGFLLNNQLTDFAANPIGTDGNPVANRLEPGKRPRSSMSPTLIFNRDADGARGRLAYVLGSPGGSVIIQFVVKTIVNMLDWGLDPQQAISAVSFGAGNTPTTGVGGEHPLIVTADNGERDPLVRALRELGHQVSVAPHISGLSALRRDGNSWTGGADPRREGQVLGAPWPAK